MRGGELLLVSRIRAAPYLCYAFVSSLSFSVDNVVLRWWHTLTASVFRGARQTGNAVDIPIEVTYEMKALFMQVLCQQRKPTVQDGTTQPPAAKHLDFPAILSTPQTSQHQTQKILSLIHI